MRLSALTLFTALTAGQAVLAEEISSSALLFLDPNRDGQVGSGEFSAQMGVLFDAMDTNGSRQIDFEEVQDFIGKDLFDAADTDGNGRMSRKEFDAQIAQDFSASDSDGDGALD